MPKQKNSAMQKVNPGIRDRLQEGFVDNPPPKKPEPEPENLSYDEQIERQVYERILYQLIPKFPMHKLKKQSFERLKKFFEVDVIPAVQEEIVRRYNDMSP